MIEAVKKTVLRKLVRTSTWGGKHMPLRFALEAVPARYRRTPQGRRAIKAGLKELSRDGWILFLSKRTGKTSEDHVSLNPRKARAIKEYLDD